MGRRIKLALLLTALVGVPLYFILGFGAARLDGWMPDAEDAKASVWLRTKDAAPGDDVAVRVVTHTGLRSAIGSVRVQLGDVDFQIKGAPQSWGGTIQGDGNEDDATFAVAIPASAATGPARLSLTIDMAFAKGDGYYFENHAFIERISVPFDILEPGARDTARLVHRGEAVLWWLVAIVLAYAAVRWIRPQRRVADKVSEVVVRVMVIAIVLSVVGIAVIGQLVFARPILCTVALPAWSWNMVLLGVWCTAIVIGAILGARARRRDDAWKPARLRTIIGHAKGSAYREVALPAELSRDVEPVATSVVTEALRANGLTITPRRRRLDVADSSGPIARLYGHDRWMPATTRVFVHDDADVTPIVTAFTTVFGPLEYMTPMGETFMSEG
jgi:hypothetical protein